METLTIYRFKHSENFSDNYKIAFEKKGRLPQIVIAKLQTKESGGIVWTCPFKLSQTFSLSNAQKKTSDKTRAFIGGDIEIFLTESRFFYKKGDFCFSTYRDCRYKGQRRGRYEMHGVKFPPSVYLEIFDGKQWKKYEK